MATEVVQLIATLKRELKSQGKTYRDLAGALDLSEASVKRLFSSERFTVERLARISAFLGSTLAEMCQRAADSLPEIATLTEEQELQLVSDPRLLLVAVCVLNRWEASDIGRVYELSAAEILKRLIVLDRMALIELLPGDRARRRVRRDFEWRPDGPIKRFFREQGLSDFLHDSFNQAEESLEFAHGMLTTEAREELLTEMRRLRRTLARLHEDSEGRPLHEKRGVGLLLGTRGWELPVFSKLRRRVPVR
ncbi:MAG TPA: helix-turn-helix transcriptional regulator [Silvibacterium sp.]|nr:helix-turn-helix transcriptional regulator [Silvibacterium sp.]